MLQLAFGSCVTNGTTKVSGTCVYLDANVFIEMWENRHTEFSRQIWSMFSIGMQRGWCFISSELTLAEVLVDPIANAKKTNDWSLVDIYRAHVANKGSFQRIVAISRDILDNAANVRSENAGIRTPDAIHLATALINKCSVFVSNDKRFANALRRDLMPKHLSHVLTFDDLSNVSAIN
jgi:predicted nucleic acid-binding protein